MISLIWKTYYKLKFRRDYARRISDAKQIGGIVEHSTCHLGSLGCNYNSQGEKIRQRIDAKLPDRRHPLIKKYF